MSRMRRVAKRAAGAIALGAVFSAASALGLALHSNRPATRRLVARVVTERLAGLFQGTIVVRQIDELSLGRSTTLRARVEVLDPDQRPAIVANGLDVHVDLAELSSSLKGKGPPSLVFTKAHIADLDLVLDKDEGKGLALARAFQPKQRAAAEPPRAAVDTAESIRLLVPALSVKHVHAHGNIAPTALDADADELTAKIWIAENVLHVAPIASEVTLRSPKAPTQSGPMHGKVDGEVKLPLAGGELEMIWDLHGDAAGVPFTSHVGLWGDRVDATVDVPRVSPQILTKGFAFAAPVARPVDLHANVNGRLDSTLKIEARAHAGAGEIVAHGTLSTKDASPFSLDADLTNIDAAAVGGPASAVTAHAHADGVLGGSNPGGSFRLDANEGSVDSTPTPVVALEGKFDARAVHAKLHARQSGLDVASTIEVDLPAKRISFDATARAPSLASLKQAPGMVSGSATARAVGTADLATDTITGRVTVDATDVARAPAKLARVHAEASVAGPLKNPSVNVTADATDLTLTAPEREPLAYPSARARARVSFAPSLLIVDANVDVAGTDAEDSIAASAAEIRIANGSFVVRDGKVSGLGTPLDVEAHATASGGISVRAHAKDVDLHRARRMTGIRELELLPEGSRASFDIDVTSGPGGADGLVDVVLTSKDGTSAEVHAILAGKHVRGRARVAKPDLGWVEVSRAEIDLPGAPSAKSFEQATGTIDLRGELDLAKGGALFAGDRVREMSGVVTLSGRIERASPTNLPRVAATLKTRDLEVMVESDSEFPTRIAGIDGAVHVAYDGATDDAEVGLVTWDSRGLLASADIKSRVPIVAWLRGKETFDRRAIGALEISGVADAAQRRVEDLPGRLAHKDFRGKLSAHLDVSGTVLHPLVELAVDADDVREKRPPPGQQAQVAYRPVDGSLNARWDGERVVATLKLDEAERARPLDLHDLAEGTQGTGPLDAKPRPEKRPGHVRALVLGGVRAEDLLFGNPLDWNASAELDVRDLELGPLPLPMNARGAITAHVSLHDLARDPRLFARAHVERLALSGARLAAGDLEADVKSGAITAKASVAQDDGGSAKVDLTSAALSWKGFHAVWDGTKPARLDYEVDRMRLSIVRPIVRRSIPEIDGVLNGRGSASVDETTQAFEGGLTLEGGRMYVNALGDEITDITARATFERHGVFRVSDVSGRVGAAVMKAAASGRMKGLGLDTADVVVLVPSKDGVPLGSEGANYAQATGEVQIAVRMSRERHLLTADVTVPRARIEVPDRGAQNLQPLEPDETIAIGIRKNDGSLAPVLLRPPSRQQLDPNADAPLTARVSVTLGDEVTLEGHGLRLTLTGRTLVEVAREIAVTGQIDLKSGGTIDVQGRKFVVDRGIVTFGGKDPADPTVIAAAYWDAPDRTRVWVEFQGPLKSGRLTLRSEPPYSKNEILSILLFGRPDPNQTTGQSKANAVTGAAATAGLNKALGELSEDFDLEQDQTSANRQRTKLGYRIRRNLKVQLGYASGVSQREPDTTYLFVEWQFVPKWSIVGTRGDRGTSILDVLFQHRY